MLTNFTNSFVKLFENRLAFSKDVDNNKWDVFETHCIIRDVYKISLYSYLTNSFIFIMQQKPEVAGRNDITVLHLLPVAGDWLVAGGRVTWSGTRRGRGQWR